MIFLKIIGQRFRIGKHLVHLACAVLYFAGFASWAQNHTSKQETTAFPETDFYDYRGTQAVSVSGGTALITGDYANPEFGYYFGLGYKKSLIPHININLDVSKFTLIDKGTFNDNFMSVDINIEILAFPQKRFSPFVSIGGGVHGTNYFETNSGKAQAGLGVEYIIYEGLSFRLFGIYNEVFSNELSGGDQENLNDVYWRIAGGVSFYFGGQKKKSKLLQTVPSIIKTNPIPADK